MPDNKKLEEQITYGEAIRLMRGAIEDRATWFHLLTKEMAAAGVDPEPIARRAIREFGCLKSNRMVPTANMEEFIRQFTGGPVHEVFAMDVVECTEDQAVVQFHYCPLVEAWKKLGCPPDRVDYLCQWAVEGDYGVMSNFPDFAFNPEMRLAAGDAHCKMVFTRKRQGESA